MSVPSGQAVAGGPPPRPRQRKARPGRGAERWRSLAAISARLLMDGRPKFAAISTTMQAIPPAKSHATAKIHPWGCRDLTSPLVMMAIWAISLLAGR